MVAPDLALADAYATAAAAQGLGALGWLGRLPGVRAVLVTHEGMVFRNRPVDGGAHLGFVARVSSGSDVGR